MQVKITSSIAAKIFITVLLIIICYLVPLFFVSTSALNEFGTIVTNTNEQQIKAQAYSYLRKFTLESAHKHETNFEKISNASSFLALQASNIYRNSDLYSINPTKTTHLKLDSNNNIFYSPRSDQIVTLYWGGPIIKPQISSEFKSLSHLDSFLIDVKNLIPEASATHIITESGIGKYYTINLDAKKAAFELPPTSVFDLRDGEPVTIFKNATAETAETKWTSIYKDDAIDGFMITATSPIFDVNDNFKGITGIDLPLDYIIDELLDSGDSSKIEKQDIILFSFLVNQKGDLIAFPEKYYSLFGIQIKQSKFKHSDDVLNFNLADSSKVNVRDIFNISNNATHDQPINIVLDEENYIVSIADINNPTWHLGIVTREKDLLRSIKETRSSLSITKIKLIDKFWWYSFISLAIAIFILFWTIRYLVNPLKKLTQISSDIAKGKLTSTVQSTRNDEIGILEHSFFDMVEQLRLAKNKEVKHLSQLEEKVRERTLLLKEKNSNLIDSEKRFRELSNAAFEGIIIHDNGIILDANLKSTEMHGYSSADEVIGKHIMQFIAPENKESTATKISLGFDKPYEAINIKKDGSTFPVEVCAKSIPYNQKQCRVVTIRDITEQKEHEREKEILIKELHQAEIHAERDAIKVKAVSQDKLASLGLLATGVAHEMNQPLTYIKIIIQSFLKDIDTGNYSLDEFKEDGSEAIKQIARISTIIDHLRSFSRADSLEFEIVSIEEILKNTLILMSPRLKLKNISFKNSLGNHLPPIKGNANKLEQVFINFMQNSIDSLEGISTAEISVSIHSDNGQNISIIFADNGEGISDENIDKIFEPFFTTKEIGKGTGLGLSIVHGIIQEHNGKIEYIKNDQGAAFLITLPVAK